MNTLTFGSLFAGIGGMDLGLERAGMQCKWQVEIDPYAQKVLAKHWPDVARRDDVRAVHGDGACPANPGWEPGCPNCLPRVDVICGGFPCQDISNAGLRAGIDGERSGLWSEFARIIREVRPRYVLVENVSALLARGLGRVLGDLAESGFDAEWDCIPAVAVGAPHRRDRLFLVAHAVGAPLRQQSESESGRRGSPVARADGAQVAVADAAIFSKRKPADEADAVTAGGDARPILGGGSWWASEPDVGRVVDGFSSGLDRDDWEQRLQCLGNAVVPQVAEFVGRRIVAHAAKAEPPKRWTCACFHAPECHDARGCAIWPCDCAQKREAV